MRKTQLVVVLILSSWGSCYAADSDDDKALIAEMQSITSVFMQKLGKTLKTTIQAGGAKSAIHVCQTVAPELANQLSRETGWKVSRVSLKVRNPLIGTPDDWEQEQLRHFSKVTVSDGRLQERLEASFIGDSSERRSIRYLRALPTGPLCLTCHGQTKDIPEDVASTLEELYPHDKATGYKLGDIRGAISIHATED